MNMIKTTKEQRKALYRKYQQDPNGSPSYRHFRKRVVQGWDCIMIPWCNMLVGIETDGYTHT